ncbi:MAG TPA: OsmC family protein [Sandaracinaceae bacterium]
MTIRTTTEAPGALRQVVTVDAHTLHADASVASGGGASAPSPHDYFDLSLATCKALTVSIVAKRRGYPLERVTVDVTRDDSEERKGKYVLLTSMELEGALSDEQRQVLYRVAERCPIQKLMTESTVEVRMLPREET